MDFSIRLERRTRFILSCRDWNSGSIVLGYQWVRASGCLVEAVIIPNEL